MNRKQQVPRLLAPLHKKSQESIEICPDDLSHGASAALSSDMAAYQDRGQHQARRVACRDCRQAKLRCDGLDVDAGIPCKRCRRQSLQCQFTSKLDELAEEVKKLRTAVDLHDDHNTRLPLELDHNLTTPAHSTSSKRVDNSSSTLPLGVASQCNLQEELDSSREPPQRVETETSTRSLEDVRLSGDGIDALFRIYFEHYHHYLEILEPTRSPNEYHDKSALLFWCIVAVAARKYPTDAMLLVKICPHVKHMIWDTIANPPHTQYTVQAILLASVWSFPANSMSTDITFMLASLARSAAMQLGLHRPETVQDFLRVKTRLNPQEFEEAVKIWAGCYIATQSAATLAGQPPDIRSDWVIKQACEIGSKYTLPDSLRRHVIIYRFMTRVQVIMSGNGKSDNDYPIENESSVLMTILEKDLADLAKQVSKDLRVSDQILLAMAGLQLMAYYFFMKPNSETRRYGLLKAYNSALSVIEKTADADAKWDVMSYVPSKYIQLLTMAAIILMKIANSSYSEFIDTAKTKRAFDTALVLVNKASVETNDIWERVNKILSQLWKSHHSLAPQHESEPNLKIRSRWGASLVHDELWEWREKFGFQESHASNVLQTETNDEDQGDPTDKSHGQEIETKPGPSEMTLRNIEQLEDTLLYENGGSFDFIGDDSQDMNWLWGMGWDANWEINSGMEWLQDPTFQTDLSADPNISENIVP